MQYRTWKTYYCKFLVLAGYLRSFYQFFFVNFGFGSLSCPFNCHLKQFQTLFFHPVYIHVIYIYKSLNPRIRLAKERSLNCQMVFFEGFWGGCGPKVCSKTTLDMRILSSFWYSLWVWEIYTCQLPPFAMPQPLAKQQKDFTRSVLLANTAKMFHEAGRCSKNWPRYTIRYFIKLSLLTDCVYSLTA